MESLDKYKYIIIPIALLLFVLSVVIGLIRHNDKEDDYFKILKEYCGYERNEIFGNNAVIYSTIILFAIGAYIGLLFLSYKIKVYHPKNENIFYNWNKGKKRNTIKIHLFSFFFPLILLPCFIFISYEHFTLKFIVLALSSFLYGFLSMGILLYYGFILFKKDECAKDDLLSIKIFKI